MSQACKPQLLDIVAVQNDIGETDVEIDHFGSVVEVLPPDGVEVQFLDCEGRTRCVATFNVKDLLVLNRERTRVA
jgi:hypothetical protein